MRIAIASSAGVPGVTAVSFWFTSGGLAVQIDFASGVSFAVRLRDELPVHFRWTRGAIDFASGGELAVPSAVRAALPRSELPVHFRRTRGADRLRQQR